MDSDAQKIEELVGEACEALTQVQAGARDPVLLSGLEYLRSVLVLLARSTADDAAAHTACSAAHDIAAGLAMLDADDLLRGAA